MASGGKTVVDGGSTSQNSVRERRVQRTLVAAIDFGTTYSGIAFSLRTDYSKDKLNITGANFTVGGTQSDKVPTAVLFDAQQQFHSFGLEAENFYASLADRSPVESKTWYYFSRFKMLLFQCQNPLASDTELQDQTQRKTMPAIRVFSASIGHLKLLLLQKLEARGVRVKEDEVDWVLTIPAIWEDKAKQFMRQAAVEGGLPREQLVLAFEPEAATVYSRVLSQRATLQERPLTYDVMTPRTKFMVIDSGGGTVDVTVYEVADDGNLRELHHPSGGAWGGTQVDKAWKNMLKDAVGVKKLTAIKKVDLVSLDREFETSKRQFLQGSPVVVKIPESVRVIFTNARLGQGLSLRDARLLLSSDRFAALFESTIRAITEHVQSILALPEVGGRVDTLLLVGGFSQSILLRQALTSAFQTPSTAVVSLENPITAVCVGAVLFGHDPSVIGWRASPYTYGIETAEAFKEGEHAPELRKGDKCRGLLAALIHKGDVVSVGQETPAQSFKALDSMQRRMVIEIYRSSERNPRYVRSCEHLGNVSVALTSAAAGGSGKVVITMVTGCVEITVKARSQDSGKEYQTTLDFLSR